MAATNANKRWFLAGALSLALGVFLLILLPVCGCKRGAEARRSTGAPALDVASTNLLRTRVVATLDAPLHPGTNLIWCASFQLAWKEFATALKEKQPVVEGAEAFCGQLNAAPDPRPFLPNASYYAAAGNVADGIVAHIHRDMGKKFPSAPLPDFGPLGHDDLVAYGYLEADVPFAIRYSNNERPAAFRETGGKEVNVKTFGICPKDHRRKDGHTPWRLLEQVNVLFGKNLPFREESSGEFAVDPFKQSPEVQLIVACVKPKETLAATLERVRSRTEETGKESKECSSGGNYLDASDTLLIPEMDWRILHHFAELEMHPLANSVRQGDPITMAVQGIAFRLDRGGASLRSEAKLVAKMAASVSAPTHFEFTKPFLVLLKKRGADQPFFVAWIDNAELLRRWE